MTKKNNIGKKGYIQFIVGKEQAFVFKSKQKEDEYIAICLTIWGGIPLDVPWAINTNIYKEQLQK